MEGNLNEAEPIYRYLAADEDAEIKLRAYALVDLGDILSNFEYLSRPGGYEEAERILQQSLAGGVMDEKIGTSWLSLAWVYRRSAKWDAAKASAAKAQAYYEQASNPYMVIFALTHALSFHALLGEWKEAIEVKRKALILADSLVNAKIAKARLWGRWSLEIWLGRYKLAEDEYRRAILIAQEIQDNELLNETLKRLGWVCGLQSKYDEAALWFKQAEEAAHRAGRKWWDATAKGFYGLAVIGRDLQRARELLSESFSLKKELGDYLGLQELMNGLGRIAEITEENDEALLCYQNSKDLSWVGRNYYTCESLAGLVRVKHAQREYAAIPPLLAEAEQLAQQYEYNDHLASLRLSQGHIAWDGHIPEWGSGFDAALCYYQQALIYALRYNRFLLDEVLGGRPQGTPLHPIIPECLKRGEEGRRMLLALRDWWQTGVNDVGTPRPDTISPIPEGIPLLEAERIAREREPGDGSPQKSVLEQIDGALKEMGAG